jgi:hypothetical protein
MAHRVDSFKKDVAEQPRRYPWAEWCDGSIWEIRQGADYDVPTENMRVNLHEHARTRAWKVRTEKINDTAGEGLRFCFTKLEVPSPIITPLAHRRPGRH